MESGRHRIAVLASGGIESAVLVSRYLKRSKTVFPIYIESGHTWETAERYWLRKFLARIRHRRLQPLTQLSVPASDLYPKHWSQTGKNTPRANTPDQAVYLPGKNILILGKAAVFCAEHRIADLALGPLKRNPFPDATQKFFKAMASALSRGLGMHLWIHAPFLSRSKHQVIQEAGPLPIHLTFSCLRPKGTRHCGDCNKCAERKSAFRKAGIPDRTRYASQKRGQA